MGALGASYRPYNNAKDIHDIFKRQTIRPCCHESSPREFLDQTFIKKAGIELKAKKQ
jgi:hypothetical protein